MNTGNNLYDAIVNQGKGDGVEQFKAQVYAVNLFETTRVNLTRDEYTDIQPGEKLIRICEITGGTGRISVGGGYTNLLQTNSIFISCDEATNVYNSQGKESPIVAYLSEIDSSPRYEFKWMTPFEIPPNIFQLTFRALMPVTSTDPDNTFYDETGFVESYLPFRTNPSSELNPPIPQFAIEIAVTNIVK